MTQLPLVGARNARDVGGLRTESGREVRPLRLLRSARLNMLTDADREWLASIGLRTVIDLRQGFEIAAWPDALGTLDVVRVNTPPSLEAENDPAVTFFGVYLSWLDESGTAFADAVRALARPGGLPALVHCTAGKDRTGLLVALVLDVLGVDEKAIVADYMESDTMLKADPGDVVYRFAIDADLITGSLAHVRTTFGSTENYLLAHGVTAEEIAALRDGLL
ncbi:tyrosine-protein phosphatase [Catenulispora subtropica]|uniref:Tyrosine-protein phosphatase n=1 Tax=Catenulispora subtropica TaxID=450798 RepID=A0ABP5BXM7_9ACTN